MVNSPALVWRNHLSGKNQMNCLNLPLPMLCGGRLCGGEEGKGGLDSDPAVQRFWVEKAALHGSREVQTQAHTTHLSPE